MGCPSLSTLNLWVCSSVSDAGVCDLVQVCTGLESLDLRLCNKVTAASVLAVAASCPRLRCFYLERAGRVDTNAVVTLSEGCPLLSTLDLGWCEIGDQALEALASACPHLSTVSLAYCDAITDRGLVRAYLAGNLVGPSFCRVASRLVILSRLLPVTPGPVACRRRPRCARVADDWRRSILVDAAC